MRTQEEDCMRFYIRIVIVYTQADTVEYLENKMVSQESVIANVELRNCFSLLCLHMETQLVHAHLEILATVLQSLVSVQIRGHSEVSHYQLTVFSVLYNLLINEFVHFANKRRDFGKSLDSTCSF